MFRNKLPPPSAAIQARYRQLIAGIDQQIVGLEKKLAGQVHCQPGCASCCQPFAVCALEAALLSMQLPAATPTIKSSSVCCFLNADRCLLYRWRPLICRTQGLPVAYIDTDRETIEVSACLLNFPKEYIFAEETLLFLDPANNKLALLNSEYCQQNQLDATRRLMLDELLANT